MQLWVAVLILVLAVAGIIAARFLAKEKKTRIILIVILAVVAAACAVYAGLTMILVDAVSNRPADL